MNSFVLPSAFGRSLAWLKLFSLSGSFAYVWLVQYPQGYEPGTNINSYGGPSSFWFVYAAVVVGNFALLYYYSRLPEAQERMYLVSLALDLVAVGYLFTFHPATLLLLLLGLTLVTGFYNFALPRTTGIVVVFFTVGLYALAVYSGVLYDQTNQLEAIEGIGLLLVGASTIITVSRVVRYIRKQVDSVYGATQDLARDLTAHTLDESLANEDLIYRHQEIQTLLSVQSNLVSVLDWDDLFSNIIAAFRNRFKFDKFTLYLYNPDTGKLELRVESGAEKATGPLRSVEPGTGVAGWAYTNVQGVLIQDVKSDERFSELTERGKRIRSLACQPLVYRGDVLGVLALDSEKPGSFDEQAFRFLESLVPLISIAVNNSINYHEIKEESHTDNLTGLRNHRGFMETFIPLLSDAYCEDFSLAVVVLDIDGFKKINDTYGHQVGNLILIELSEILKGFFRGSDVVARFGGEEFVVVLNGTPADIAPRIAEQLRRKIDSHQFPISLNKDAFKQVTVSLGLATTSDRNLKPEIIRGSRGRGMPDAYLKNVQELYAQLVENADQALYVAKREGKNQVRLSFEYPLASSSEQPVAQASEDDAVFQLDAGAEAPAQQIDEHAVEALDKPREA